jgi:phosphonate transport system substrate-binding protein
MRAGRLCILGLVSILVWGSPAARASENTLVLGVFPRFDATTTTARFSPLAAFLSDRLARKVRLETSKDFETFWQGVVKRRYDIAHFNQYHYVRAHALYGYEAILCNEERGSRYLSGTIYTRRDSGIDKLSDLRGKRVLFGGGTDAMMSYIVLSICCAKHACGPGNTSHCSP